MPNSFTAKIFLFIFPFNFLYKNFDSKVKID